MEWDQETKTITATKDNTTIVMKISNNNMTVNGKVVKLDVAPQVVDGRTLIPVRGISESLGATVTWDKENKTVIITSGGVDDVSESDFVKQAKIFSNANESFFGYVQCDHEMIYRGFYDGFAPVKKKGKWGYVDGTGYFVIEAVFEQANAFYEGFASVKEEGGGYHYIQMKNTLV